ncbi:M1-specific T cell receptor beta chain-like [Pagrus major]|uniref:M1-specific T cell receptor beta chain-like n=1 Tax=Pagrus major TaxID=143350 RepID=UPI003CC8AF30
MIILFLCIAFNTILVSGSSLSDQVHQTPPDLFSKQGERAKISCSHSIDNYNRMLWYKQTNRELQFLGNMLARLPTPEKGLDIKLEGSADKGQNCTLTTERLELNSSAVYFCAASYHSPYSTPAYFGQGTKLTVLEPGLNVTAPTVKVLKPCKNQKGNKTLVCVASGFYPDHVSVSWEIDDVVVTKGVATDNAALRNGSYYKITSRLRVTEEVWYTEGKKFHCAVRFYDGTGYIYQNKTIKGKWKVVLTTDQYLWISRAAELSYSVLIVKSCIYGAFVAFLVWKLQGSTGKQDD